MEFIDERGTYGPTDRPLHHPHNGYFAWTGTNPANSGQEA